VTTSDSRVDPVGACVGRRGNRVQAIVRELSNERIDIINWTEELSLLVRRVFAPAEIKKVIPVGDHKIVVVINEDDLAQAIGRDGQNIRLASKMLEREIDVFGDNEFGSLSEEQRAAALSDVPAPPPEAVSGGAQAQDSVDVGAAGTDSGDDDVVYDEASGAAGEGEKVSLDDGDDEPVQGEILNDAVVSLSATDDDSETAIENAASESGAEESGV
jgi:N utilization substance protein A